MTEPGLVGRRLPDCPRSELPDTIQPGDYWKILGEDGKPVLVEEEGNLTGTEWLVAVPGGSQGWMLAGLRKHTVRENEDGTITVAPGDGSSNSILVYAAGGDPSWHGYIDRGRLYEV